MILLKNLLHPFAWVRCGAMDTVVFGNSPEIWKINISYSLVACMEKYAWLLSEEEILQYYRFRKKGDRDRFMIARISVKVILGKYLGLPPAEIIVLREKNKKPVISWPFEFSVSHSGNCVLVACDRLPVGIDVENVCPEFEHTGVAAATFAQEELDFVENAEDKIAAFYLLWTRKEAYFKRKGQGIVENLSLFNGLYQPAITSFQPENGYLASLSGCEGRTPGVCRELIFS